MSASEAKGPKIERPCISQNASGEEWNAFVRRWNTFKEGSKISNTSATPQLFECCTQQLGDVVLRGIPDFTSKPIEEALSLLKLLAVVPVALGVVRSELTALTQDADEPYRTFAARVHGKAEICEFTTSYSGTRTGCIQHYSGETYYTDEQIRDVLLNGIADTDIRREALSVEHIQSRSVNDIISFVETRETARNANTSHGVAALSAYRRKTNIPDSKNKSPKTPSETDKARTGCCRDCGKIFNLFSKTMRVSWNTKPHERCILLVGKLCVQITVEMERLVQLVRMRINSAKCQF